MKKTTLLLTLLTVGIYSYGQLSDLVTKNEKAVVQIFSYDEFGTPSSTGTGFFTDKSGIGLTNLHVIDDAKFAYIRDYKGDIFQIEKISRVNKECDLAEFIVKTTDSRVFDILNFNINTPPKGTDIFVIGNPEGLESTVSTGIISSIRDQEGKKLVQISAPISPGSSGSPIMDMQGNVIGVATYQYKKGQNLNFGYAIGNYQDLKSTTQYKLSNNGTENLFVLNKICPTESNLILNSIEVNEKNTVVNFSYTNTSLTFGDRAFIFTTIGDKQKSFYIEDKEASKRLYVYDATIGTTPKSPTYLKLGETKRFKLYFPTLGSARSVNIKEGIEGASWEFRDINLADYKNLDFKNDLFFNDFYFQTGLALLSSNQYAEAYVVLKDYADKNDTNDYAHNLAGIISHILGNNLDAFIHIERAIKINPTNDSYYFNLYYLNNEASNFDNALKNISSAIQLNDTQPEYYALRADILIQQNSWKEALADLNKFMDSDREISGYSYFQRAVCKLYLNDKTACKDLERAYQMVNKKEDEATIKEWYNKHCR